MSRVFPYVGCVVEYNNEAWVMVDKKGQTVWLRNIATDQKVNAMYGQCKFLEGLENDYRKRMASSQA